LSGKEDTQRFIRMPKTFKRGDHVEWNSEAGRVRGVIVKKVVSDIRFKGYVHHASKDEPQYIIKSNKTDHIAIHKGRALKRVKAKMIETRIRTRRMKNS
jgi:Hypervirulence associated proteins TUDOR domain